MTPPRDSQITITSDFSEIIYPLSEKTFFENYYEQRPLYRARRHRHIKDSTFKEHILRSLTEGRISYDNIDLAHNGNIIARESFLNTRDELDLTKISAHHHAGATLIINDFHKYDKSTSELNSNFQKWFSSPCGANLYITPAHQQGFSAHFDPHDVFVLQVEGKKQWRIFEAHSILPLKCQIRPVCREELGKPVLEVEMQEGDLLYIPRGWTHEAEALDSSSTHITLGIFAFTRADLILDILAQTIISDPSFRNALPPLLTSKTKTRDELLHTIKDLLKKLSEDDIVEGGINSFISRANPEAL